MSLSTEELNKLYSPSQYNQRLTPDEVIMEHIKVVSEESERVRSGSIPSRLGVPYGDTEHEVLDIFGTDLPESAPIFVYISGGYWQELSGKISAQPVEPMYMANILSIIVDYARAPGVTLSEIVGQAVKATKWIHNFATKERKSSSITLVGHSAGAQLCGMILCSPWFVGLSKEESSIFRGVVHLSGIFELQPLVRTYVNDPLGMTLEEARLMSPLDDENVTIVSENLIEKCPNFRTVILVADYEAPPFKMDAEKLAKALTSKGLANVSFQTIPKVDHFNLVEKLSMKGYVVTSMIRNLILLQN